MDSERESEVEEHLDSNLHEAHFKAEQLLPTYFPGLLTKQIPIWPYMREFLCFKPYCTTSSI